MKSLKILKAYKAYENGERIENFSEEDFNDAIKETSIIKELLKESLSYIDNTHGYDTELFHKIQNFLNKGQKNEIFNPPF